jgi:hypothetical protein
VPGEGRASAVPGPGPAAEDLCPAARVNITAVWESRNEQGPFGEVERRQRGERSLRLRTD